jgi:hypothetical protein
MFGLISKASSANYTRFDPIDPSYYTSPMAMGTRKRDRQPTMLVRTTDLPTAASHPFYTRLNQLLREHGFDDFAEAPCAAFYAATMGRPGLAPGSCDHHSATHMEQGLMVAQPI